MGQKKKSKILKLLRCGTYYVKTMEMYCVTCKKTASKNSSVTRTKQNRDMALSNWAVCGKQILRYIKNQETSRIELHLTVF